MGIRISTKFQWETSIVWSKDMISAFINWLNKKAIYRRTFRDLSIMTDRELYDLGFTRGDIHSIAYEATYGEISK
jgi:uncharacterized protein YjiS (DUF1127 family)